MKHANTEGAGGWGGAVEGANDRSKYMFHDKSLNL